MVLFSTLRKRNNLIDLCSASGVGVLYVFCAVRMLLPIEINWVRVIPTGHIYNSLNDFLKAKTGLGDYVFGDVILFVWILGFIIGIFVLCIRCITCRRKIDRLVLFGKPICVEHCISSHVQIRMVPESMIYTPISYGIVKKCILIPDRNYSDEELNLIIEHEYTHLKNHDHLVQLLINILCSMYWWNPFVYFLRIDLEQYFELRCDSYVTISMTETQIASYLELILKIYKENCGKTTGLGLGMLGIHKRKQKELKDRFLYLSRRKKVSNRKTGKFASVVIAIVFMVISYSFIFQSNYEIPKDSFAGGMNTYEVNQSNSYIIKRTDGSYFWKMEGGVEKEVTEDIVQMLVADGFELVYE